MKRIIISTILFTVLISFSSRLHAITIDTSTNNPFSPPKTFTLKGVIKGKKDGYLVLYYKTAKGKLIKDSSTILNGAFQFKGQIEEPTMGTLSGAKEDANYNDPNITSIFLEPGLLKATLTIGDFRHFKLKGSKTQNECNELEKSKSILNAKLELLSKAFDEANKDYIQAIRDKLPEARLKQMKESGEEKKDKMDPYLEKANVLDMIFIKNHPNSYHSAYLLQYKISAMPLDSGKKYYANLSADIKNSNYGKATLKNIASLQAGSSGSKAKLFNVQDINETPLDLAALISKSYVLLDFWASWCAPCRKGNPHLLSLYSKYKDKGFEIVGVSDDDHNPSAWKKAVEQDNIGVWKHVLRGIKITEKGLDKTGDINETYSIHSLPTKILIDKNGIIIGRYGGGGEGEEAMDKKLAEIFK